MTITTKTGDGGETLLPGRKVRKSSCLINALGTIDTLGSSLGLCRAHIKEHNLRMLLSDIYGMDIIDYKDDIMRVQADLFLVGAEVGASKKSPRTIEDAHIKQLEAQIKTLEKEEYFKDFYIPGETVIGALFDVTRAQCRDVERELWKLYETTDFDNKLVLIYLNRLSDLLWLWARSVGNNEDTLSNFRKRNG